MAPVLSDEDLRFFSENGYVIAKGVIDAAQCACTAQEVWDFAELEPDDDAGWASHPKAGWGGGMYHGDAQWENRTAPRVHQAFSQIWGTPRLWTTHDGTNLNLPVGDPAAPEGPLHWDCDMRLWSLAEAKAQRPIVGGVQGVLYLVDTPAANGAFVCIPGFHRRLDDWLDTLPQRQGADEIDMRSVMNDEVCPFFTAFLPHFGRNLVISPLYTVRFACDVQFRGSPELTRVEASAGDLVIWDTRLPHGRGVNRGDSPRVSQYISMMPAPADPAARRPRVRVHAVFNAVFKQHLC